MRLLGCVCSECDADTERVLLESIAECERGEAISIAQLLGELRDREHKPMSPGAVIP